MGLGAVAAAGAAGAAGAAWVVRGWRGKAKLVQLPSLRAV